MNARREFPAKVMVAAFKRSGGHCEQCTARLYVGKYAYDHVVPNQMGGAPTLENCQVLCAACHSTKTATKDVPAIAKAKRQEKAHLLRPPSKWRKPPANSKWDWKTGRRIMER